MNDAFNPAYLQKIRTILLVPLYATLLFFSMFGAVLFLWGGIIPLISNTRLVLVGNHAQGIIIDVEKNSQASPTAPRTEFITHDNQVIRFQPTSTTDLIKFHKNQKVDVLYLKNNPREAMINTPIYLWGLPGIYILIGGGFLAISLSKFRSMHRKDTNGNDEQLQRKNMRDRPMVTYFIFVLGGGIFLYNGFTAFMNQYQAHQADVLAKRISGATIDFSLPEWYGFIGMALLSLLFIGLGARGIILKLLRMREEK